MWKQTNEQTNNPSMSKEPVKASGTTVKKKYPHQQIMMKLTESKDKGKI